MSSLKIPVCAQEYIASKGVSRCISLFQGSSACAWWIWTVRPQQKNTATLFKWYLWSQRAALPKITWLWVSPFRMRHSLLMFCRWLPDESPGACREFLVSYWKQHWPSWACPNLQGILEEGHLLCVLKGDGLSGGNALKPQLPKESLSLAKFPSAEPFPYTFTWLCQWDIQTKLCPWSLHFIIFRYSHMVIKTKLKGGCGFYSFKKQCTFL